MDGKQFDSFVRNLAQGTSRRRLLKGLLGGAAAMATTAVTRETTTAAGLGEQCGGIDPPGPIIECDGGLHCCAIASSRGICLTVEHCNTPSLIECTMHSQCPGGFICCDDGHCSSDMFGENCPTTTTTTAGATTTTTVTPTTTTAAPGLNTQPGQDVVVTGAGWTITFDNVTAAGSTSVSVLASPPSTLPNSSVFDTGNGVWYEITSSASFTGSVSICLPSTDPDDRLLHFEGGDWVDITSAGYPTGGMICGETTSLSPFGVVPLLGSTGDDDDDTPPTGDDDDDDDDITPPGDDDDDDDDDDSGHGGGGKKPHPPKTGGPESVDTLPSTGSGPASGDIAKLGLTLAASAAAAAAARSIRTTDEKTSES